MSNKKMISPTEQAIRIIELNSKEGADLIYEFLCEEREE